MKSHSTPCRLDLLRHGEAAPSDIGGDSERPLTARGVRALTELAARLRREGWRPDHVFVSPFLRARQSASLVIRDLQPRPILEVLTELEPEHDPDAVIEALDAREVRSGTILLVGHQPLLGRLVAHVTGVEHPLTTAEMVRISCDGVLGRRAGRIELAIRPR